MVSAIPARLARATKSRRVNNDSEDLSFTRLSLMWLLSKFGAQFCGELLGEKPHE